MSTKGELLARLDERQRALERAVDERARTDNEALQLAREIQKAYRELHEAKLGDFQVWQSAVNVRIALWTGAGAAVAFALNWIVHR